MYSNYYPTSPDEGGETSPQSSSDTQAYWDNIEIAPWMTDMHPSMLEAGAADAQFDNTWAQPMSTSVPVDQSWAYDYGAMSTSNHFQTSRDPSPAGDYFGAVDSISLGTSYPKAVWDPNEQPMFSPYSEAPPLLGSNPQGLSVNSINPYNYPTAPSASSPPALATTPATVATPTLTTPTTARPPTYTPSPSKSKSSKSKQKSPTPSKSTTSKSKSSTSKRKPPHGMTLQDLSHPQEVHRIASEHISREAWRICKSEAVEMAQRRVQLLQHDSRALERETQQLQQNIELMRQATSLEQAGLQDALRRAERLRYDA